MQIAAETTMLITQRDHNPNKRTMSFVNGRFAIPIEIQMMLKYDEINATTWIGM